MSSPLPLIQRIKKRKDFLFLSDVGYTSVTPAFVLKCGKPVRNFHENERSKPSKSGFRLGFVVSKKVGNAVTRNLTKRRFKEISRAVMPEYAVFGYDYIIIARYFAIKRDFARMKKEFIDALKQLKKEINTFNGNKKVGNDD